WTAGSTALSQTNMLNLETQAGVALGSINPDIVTSGFILSGCAASRHNSYSATVLADTPLVYCRMDDASGTVCTDSSGNNFGLAYNNSPTLGVAGLLTGDSDTCVTFASASSRYANATSTTNLPTGAG